jgi:hypothetical protein
MSAPYWQNTIRVVILIGAQCTVEDLSAMSIKAMRSGIKCLKRNPKNIHQQPLPGNLGKTGRAKEDVNIPLSQ